ncbi:hypothetical protein ABUE34_01825 [Kozakia baliensis]|uniref:hypothetical protein n=1 Tax=Kozakia baliensis TaxID=153496 RepID=UPI00345B7472
MIFLVSILLWGGALFRHAIAQPKIQRLMGGRQLGAQVPKGATITIVLPLLALALCLRLGVGYGLLAWFGTASIGGLIATGCLTSIMAGQHGRNLSAPADFRNARPDPGCGFAPHVASGLARQPHPRHGSPQ